MSDRSVTPADLKNIEAQRLDADGGYNDALTAIDRAIPKIPELPVAPAPYDEQQLPSLNAAWNVTPPEPPPGGGLKARLRNIVWRIVSPSFQQQQAFNAQVVDHLNRNVRHERETIVAVQAMLLQAAAQAEQLAAFHARLILYLQQITAYVDTKDRSVLGQVAVVRDRAAALESAQQDIRSTCAVLNQASLTMRREVERLLGGGAVAPGSGPLTAEARPSETHAAATAAQPMESWKYVGFEDQFRGPRETIRRQLADYVPEFAGGSGVLDIGCGRGELLDLLREAGITARGLDMNHEMVEICRSRGFDAVEGDALGYLRSLEDGALGGIFAGQVIEHLEPDYLMRLLDAAFHKLRPGSRIILETINPTCWAAFFSSYIRDLTHVRPIHPDTLRYLLNASGVQQVEIRYRAPWPDHDKLQRIILPDHAAPELRAAADTLNDNVERLNGRLFSYMDYAAIGTRL